MNKQPERHGVVAGQYELMVGSSSADKDLKKVATTLK